MNHEGEGSDECPDCGEPLSRHRPEDFDEEGKCLWYDPTAAGPWGDGPPPADGLNVESN